MKKLLSIILILGCILLCSCEDEVEYVDPSNTGSNVAKGYSFSYNGETVNIGESKDSVVGKFGEYNSSFVAESCAYQGTDRYYYYDDFELMTSEIDGKEILTNIFVDKKDVKTVEDVVVGMEISKMAASLGPADKSTSNSYTYYSEGMNIQINTKDDKVVSVEYYYVQE